MSKKMMKVIDPSSGLMECKVCGSRHYSDLRPNSVGGGYYRGSWQCQYREDEAHEAWRDGHVSS